MAPRQCLALFFVFILLLNLPLALGQVRWSVSKSGTDLTTFATTSISSSNATTTIVEVTVFVGIMVPASASVKIHPLSTELPANPVTSDLDESTWDDIKYVEKRMEQWLSQSRIIRAYNGVMLIFEILAPIFIVGLVLCLVARGMLNPRAVARRREWQWWRRMWFDVWRQWLGFAPI